MSSKRPRSASPPKPKPVLNYHAGSRAKEPQEGQTAISTESKMEEENHERQVDASDDNDTVKVGGGGGGEEDSKSKIWDLPLSLAGKIASYKTGTTADVAKLREVSRAFGQTIRSQISSKNVSHAIACPTRLGGHCDLLGNKGSWLGDLAYLSAHKSFVSALTRLGKTHRGYSILEGDIFDCRNIDQSIFSSRDGGVTLERLFMLSHMRGEVNNANARTFNDESADGGIRDAIAQMENASSTEEFESICRDAKSRGLFAPIQGGENLRDDYSNYHVMAVFNIREGADCIVSTSDAYLELRTDDIDINEDDISDIHPAYPESLYMAPISETVEFEDEKYFRVCVLMEIFCSDYWDGDLLSLSSLSYDLLKRDHQNRVGPVEGVAVVDDFLGEDLVQTLTADIDALASYQEEQNSVDYHPNSNDIVRDIVHPGLFSYVKGVSVLRNSVRDTKPCSFDEKKQAPHELDSDRYGGVDFWGRNEWDIYQWLPTYFDISAAGECNIEHYINGLTPRHNNGVNSDLYLSLAKLFEHALPYISSVYSYVRYIRPLIREGDEVGNGMPKVVDVPKLTPCDLKGHKLQVITKIVDYELKPGQSHEGVWHVEGMSQEDIVLTALYILDRDDCISGGDLMFKRAFLADEAEGIFWTVSQSRPMALEKEIKNGLVPLGKVKTNKGRLIVFPNSHVHKVTEMINENDIMQNECDGDTVPASKRRIVVFFLVNPLRRIVSTREVAPQKGGSMTHDDALKHRLELMKARKYHKQDWNVRDIHLCEH